MQIRTSKTPFFYTDWQISKIIIHISSKTGKTYLNENVNLYNTYGRKLD